MEDSLVDGRKQSWLLRPIRCRQTLRRALIAEGLVLVVEVAVRFSNPGLGQSVDSNPVGWLLFSEVNGVTQDLNATKVASLRNKRERVMLPAPQGVGDVAIRPEPLGVVGIDHPIKQRVETV